jgi:uncharacterized protein GlcG (DUF336 family)
MSAVKLDDARRVISAAEKKAREIGQPMNIAVADEGGNIVAHIRMDNAWIGSIDISMKAIRLLVSVNLLYAAIFLKFAGVPDSVTLFTQMSQAVHGLVSQPVFRLGSGAFETVVAVLLLIPKTARLGAGLTVVWMTAVVVT